MAIVAVALAMVAGVTGGSITAAKSHKLFADPDRASAKNRTSPGRTRDGSLPAATQLAVEELQDRAYPAATLPFAWQKGARDYFTGSIRNRGADGAESWQLAGPSTATYPAILNRTNADYVDAGRTTAIAISPTCTAGNCRLWIAAAGGGVWRTDDALAPSPAWKFVSGSFGTSAIGSLTYDAASRTLYAGTGEPNSSADSEAGIGIYKSTDGGDSWSLVPGSAAIAAQNSVASIIVSGSSLYVATTYGIAGIAGVGGGAIPSYIAPGTPAPGLYKLNADGSSSLLFDDTTGAWGINHAEIDGRGTLYIASEGKGIFRSANGGQTWEQVFKSATSGNRTEFALNTQTDGHTRIYVGDGGSNSTTTAVYRGDSIDTKSAATLITGGTNGGYTKFSTRTSGSGYLLSNYCTGQCWYDNYGIRRVRAARTPRAT